MRDNVPPIRWPKLRPPKDGNHATVGCLHEACGCCDAKSTGLRDNALLAAPLLCIVANILNDEKATGGLPLHWGSSMLLSFEVKQQANGTSTFD